MRKIKFKGSMTVEAAVLFPIILMLIVILIYLTFFLHDSSKLQSKIHNMMIRSKSYMLYETPLYGISDISYEEILEDDSIKVLEEYARTQLEQGFFVYRLEQIRMELKGSYIHLTVEGNIELPFVLLEPLFTKVKNFKKIDKINITSTTSEIRLLSKLIDTVESLGKQGEGEED